MQDDQKNKLRRLVPKLLMDGPLTADEVMQQLKGRFTLRLSTPRILKTLQGDKGVRYDKKLRQFSLNNESVQDTESTQNADSIYQAEAAQNGYGAAKPAVCTSISRQKPASRETTQQTSPKTTNDGIMVKTRPRARLK